MKLRMIFDKGARERVRQRLQEGRPEFRRKQQSGQVEGPSAEHPGRAAKAMASPAQAPPAHTPVSQTPPALAPAAGTAGVATRAPAGISAPVPGTFQDKAEQEKLNKKLVFAVRQSDVDAARKALSAGADANVKGRTYGVPGATHGFIPGMPPVPVLTMAAMEGNKPMVEMLIAYGADVNADSGNCPGTPKSALSRAREGNHTDIVEILKRSGARE